MRYIGEGIEDLLGGHVSDERIRVVVPSLDLFANVFLQCCNIFVYTTAEQLIGQEYEPLTTQFTRQTRRAWVRQRSHQD